MRRACLLAWSLLTPPLVTAVKAGHLVGFQFPHRCSSWFLKSQKSMDEEAIQQYVDEFVGVVGAHGLSEEAFKAASLECIKDALYLVSRGMPVNELVSIMNSSPDAGEAQLDKLVQPIRAKERSKRQTIDQIVKEQQKAGDLIRSSPQAFAAELHALFLYSEDEDELASMMAELFKVQSSARQGNFPDLKSRAIGLLDEDERISLGADCQETIGKLKGKP